MFAMKSVTYPVRGLLRAALPVIQQLENRCLLSAGDPDVRFGSHGQVLSNLVRSDVNANDVVTAAGGRIVVAATDKRPDGHFELTLRRYTSTGAIDTAFGSNGSARVDIGTTRIPFHLKTMTDGRLVVAGNNGLLRRFTASGAPDPTFGGGDGAVTDSRVTSTFALRSDGRIVTVQSNKVYQFTAAGARDGSFHSLDLQSRFTFPEEGTNRLITQVTILHALVQSDGKLVLTGVSSPSSSSGVDAAVVRLQPNGEIDNSFSGDGFQPIDLGTFEQGVKSVIQSDGKIVVLDDIEDGVLGVARLNSDGALDSSFGGGTGFGPGNVRFTFGGLAGFGNDANNQAADLLVEPNGRIVVTGTVRLDPDSNNFDTAVKAFTSSGGDDESFGLHGETVLDLTASNEPTPRQDFGQAGVLTTDGRLVVVATTGQPAPDYLVPPLNPLLGVAKLFAGTPMPWTINGTGGADTIRVSLAGGNVVAQVNGVTIGSRPASSVGPLTINAGDGNDIVTVGAGVPHATINGQGGNDSLRGGDFADALSGGAGDDSIDGAAGNDEYSGGDGKDTLSFASHAGGVRGELNFTFTSGPEFERRPVGAPADFENLVGGSGNDILIGSNGNNVMRGGPGNDLLAGQDGADALFGDTGNDTLDGAAGNDFLSGLDGNDSMRGGNGNDVLDGGFGNDQFFGDAGNDTADYHFRGFGANISLDDIANDGPRQSLETDNVHSDIETVLGTAGADLIVGNDANNRLEGNAGNDTIRGGGGNDIIVGGTGADQLFGDAGNDTFFAKDNTRDTVNGGAGTDTAQRDTSGSASDVVSSVEVFV